LPDGNTYRTSIIGNELIEPFIEKYGKASLYSIQSYVSSLNPGEDIEIMFKNRGTAQRLFLEEINTVFKVTQETPLGKNQAKPKLTQTEKMLYRYKQRVSFNINKILD